MVVFGYTIAQLFPNCSHDNFFPNSFLHKKTMKKVVRKKNCKNTRDFIIYRVTFLTFKSPRSTVLIVSFFPQRKSFVPHEMVTVFDLQFIGLWYVVVNSPEAFDSLNCINLFQVCLVLYRSCTRNDSIFKIKTNIFFIILAELNKQFYIS